MTPQDDGRSLLIKAADDIRVFEKLIDDSTIQDETLGFHAQQAIEKSCKAVLRSAQIKYPKTHDLSELLRILDQNKITRPFDDAALEFLTPYATVLRYEDSSDQNLDRSSVLTLIKQVFSWAEKQIG
jgi:HEPN domain-containing protein